MNLLDFLVLFYGMIYVIWSLLSLVTVGFLGMQYFERQAYGCVHARLPFFIHLLLGLWVITTTGIIAVLVWSYQ